MQYFLNLAGGWNTPASMIATTIVQGELLAAQIPEVRVFPNERFLEVMSEAAGVFEFQGGAVFGFQRYWRYHVVNGTHPFPFEAAHTLNEAWGETVRVNGMAGGDDVPPMGVRHWHVDTWEGLRALAESLTCYFGQPTTIRRSIQELTRLSVLYAVRDGSLP